MRVKGFVVGALGFQGFPCRFAMVRCRVLGV